MDAVLLVDFGSTYTKLTAVDIENEEILGTAKALTTVESDIMTGFYKAYELLKEQIKGINVNFVDKFGCSSAAGGLKMVAVGLIPDLTAEAAKRAALGAGARVLDVYCHELNKSEIKSIIAQKPDIILIAGGTNGGNKDCIIHNARMISKNVKNIPVVVAGNKNARDTIEAIFDKENVDYIITENVMPKLNELNVEPARSAIREVFMKKIVEAKGMKNVESLIGNILMPTPAAVLRAAKILADVGGATTDVYSIAEGQPTKAGVMIRGLEEPYAKRTVEGDLGMRVSIQSLWESVGTRKIKKNLPDTPYDIEKRCKELASNVNFVPDTAEEKAFDHAIAKVAIATALNRHVGTVECVYTPMGTVYAQTGKDLLNIGSLIGTGGVIVHSENFEELLKAALFDQEDPNYLKPLKPKMFVDKSYILSAMGLLAEKYPDKSLRILKKYLV